MATKRKTGTLGKAAKAVKGAAKSVARTAEKALGMKGKKKTTRSKAGTKAKKGTAKRSTKAKS